MQFTNLHPLESLAQVNVTGVFDTHWDGWYARIWLGGNSYRQPTGAGSGLLVPSLPLLPRQTLPADLGRLAEAPAHQSSNIAAGSL